MHRAAAFVHLDIPIHGAQILHAFNSRHAQRAIDGTNVLYVRAVRHAYRVLHRHFHPLVLRISRGHRNHARLRVHLDGHEFEVRLLVFRSLHRVDLDRVAIPALHVHGAVDVLQFKRAARLQRIGLIEFFGDTQASRGGCHD